MSDKAGGPVPELRVLSKFELAEIARVAPMSSLLLVRVSTADVRPIDAAAAAAVDAWAKWPCRAEAPAVEVEAVLEHPPAPERFAHLAPANRRDGWTESAPFEIQGVDAAGRALIFARRRDAPPGMSWSVWGFDPKAWELVHRRSIALEAARAVSPESLSELHRRDVESALPPWADGLASPRARSI